LKKEIPKNLKIENRPFIKHLTEVIQQNNLNTKKNRGTDTNSLNVNGSQRNVYTSESVQSKIGSLTINKAINNINKML